MDIKQITSHPLLGLTPGLFAGLLIENGFRPNFITFIKIIYIFFSALPLGILAILESIIYGRKIAKIKIVTDPVFIIGHWRSGTTFLHYMMAADKRMAYINNHQTFLPRSMLVARRLTFALAGLQMYKKRPMDDVAMAPDSPQEEEYALTHYGIGSYLGCFFPRKMKYYFLKYADLESCTPQEVKNFKKHYFRLIQKITFANGNMPLLLKNPVSTVRIKTLLELFPKAKFIYLHRNPYEVYYSTCRLHEKVIEAFTLQNYNLAEIHAIVPEIYKFFLKKYEADKKLIPQSQLIEISYEELMQDPLNSLEKIYKELQLPEFNAAKELFVQFLKTQKEYKPANYQITPETKKHIDELLCLNN